MADRTSQVLHASDGRALTVAQWGDPYGTPVLQLHGTPGSRLDRHPDEALVRAAGVRLVTFDRPGYGGSDRHRGRRVVECIPDVEVIADVLGIARFAVTGRSGGGPHALAVAAGLAARATRVACTGGIAPYDALGDAWFAGMDPEMVEEFRLALEGEEPLAELLRRRDHRQREAVLADPPQSHGDVARAASDRPVESGDDDAEILRHSTFEQTRNGVWGWVDDDLACTLPWGFDPSSIAVPARIEYGIADVLVPPSHGEWLARRVTGAEVKVHGAGYPGDADADHVERLAWLTGP